jgi:hypothetical protein
MQFMLAKDGWSVSFLEEDCRTSLPCHFVFQSELNILDMARRGGADFNLAGPSAHTVAEQVCDHSRVVIGCWGNRGRNG